MPVWTVLLWICRAAWADPGELVEPEARTLWTSQGDTVNFGWAVADLPDINGDGVRDVVTGDPYARSNSGLTVVLSGKDGTRLFELPGGQNSYEGYAMSGVGDQDGDGVWDILSGVPGKGTVKIYSGATGVLLDTVRGESREWLGTSMAQVGDTNGDGVDDFAAGAESSDSAGEDAGRVYLVSGADHSFLWQMDGEAAGDFLGSGTGEIGDCNGDGVPDVVVGARGNGGRVYLLSGVDGAVILRLEEENSASLGAFFVSGVGDVDGDGVPDIYGGDFANISGGFGAGRAWVWSGATGDELLTFTGASPGDGLGPGRGAGDVNGDGVPDIVIGSYLNSDGAEQAGAVTVFSGKDASVLRTYTSTTEGENLGFDAVGLGDVDGDGQIDILASAATGNRVYLFGAAQPADTGDSGGADTGDTGEEAADTGENEAKTACGCSHSGGASRSMLAVALGLLVARRRRRA